MVAEIAYRGETRQTIFIEVLAMGPSPRSRSLRGNRPVANTEITYRGETRQTIFLEVLAMDPSPRSQSLRGNRPVANTEGK